MTINDILHHLPYQATLLAGIKAGVYVLVGYILALAISKAIRRLYEKRPQAVHGLLVGKIIFYTVFILFIISALRAAGFELHVLLGATGLLTVALGFASQTATTNFISGLFLLGEHAFQPGETISLNDITGEVISIDWLSIKLRQSDNTLVRIPNEMMIKSPVINLTRFPQRCFNCVLTVPLHITLRQWEALTLPALTAEPLCLQNPAPQWTIKDIMPVGVSMQLSVWAAQANVNAVKNRVLAIVQEIYSTHFKMRDFNDRSQAD